MSASLYGPIVLDLKDGPVSVRMGLDSEGRPFARLILGEGSQQVAISVTNCDLATLADLRSAAAELADWGQRANRLASLPEVA
ncbi:hypothetical protein ACFWMH_27820 [Streptomyces tendae]|uniref:hypothetical protein n=1 Tax=Streptomyces tendae TaxID=1932 RepID=UPI003668560E